MCTSPLRMRGLQTFELYKCGWKIPFRVNPMICYSHISVLHLSRPCIGGHFNPSLAVYYQRIDLHRQVNSKYAIPNCITTGSRDISIQMLANLTKFLVLHGRKRKLARKYPYIHKFFCLCLFFLKGNIRSGAHSPIRWNPLLVVIFQQETIPFFKMIVESGFGWR